MPHVQIRDVPDDVHEALVRRAQQTGQSLQQFLASQPAEIAATPTVKDILDRIEQRPKGTLSVDAAIDDMLAFPITVYPTAPLLRRVWELRPNVTVYDGCYVALAEALGVPLVTADQPPASVPDLRCAVEVACP